MGAAGSCANLLLLLPPLLLHAPVSAAPPSYGRLGQRTRPPPAVRG